MFNPVQRDASVISLMAPISEVSRDGVAEKEVNMVNPTIGPFTAGLLDLLKPGFAAVERN